MKFVKSTPSATLVPLSRGTFMRNEDKAAGSECCVLKAVGEMKRLVGRYKKEFGIRFHIAEMCMKPYTELFIREYF